MRFLTTLIGWAASAYARYDDLLDAFVFWWLSDAGAAGADADAEEEKTP